MLVKDDYERLKMIRKTKIDKKRFDVIIILKKRGRKTKNKKLIFDLGHFVYKYINL